MKFLSQAASRVVVQYSGEVRVFYKFLSVSVFGEDVSVSGEDVPITKRVFPYHHPFLSFEIQLLRDLVDLIGYIPLHLH